jgi:hypothetical protein
MTEILDLISQILKGLMCRCGGAHRFNPFHEAISLYVT